ncbi:MAG: TauD/TfdA family dioxygenase [Alphaproteobacteria bacterium]|jgi:taurine dioxygenase|nr:TauD/TfdA family dioxygenase [Alphaproteobacteria bacterium]MDP6830284.1 TauD/TfdA family dioxygenase [Alphaproteobacteria bacterium]
MQTAALGDNGLAAEVTDLDLTVPVPDQEMAQLRAVFQEHPVLCIRTDGLTPEQYLDFCRRLGTIQIQLLEQTRHPEHPEISYIATGQIDQKGTGQRVVAGAKWHTDDSYLQQPCWATLLYANIIPKTGGDTQFTDMRAACAALPDELRGKIEGRRAGHAYLSRRNINHVPQRSAEGEAASQPASHPIICRHPHTGRETLYLNPNRIEHIEGIPEGEGDGILDQLYAFAIRPEFLYRHKWQEHDILIWDNRCTMHKASDDYQGQQRQMLRVLIAGDAPQ